MRLTSLLMTPPFHRNDKMATPLFPRPEGTKIELIAASENESESLDQLALEWIRRQRDLKLDAVDFTLDDVLRESDGSSVWTLRLLSPTTATTQRYILAKAAEYVTLLD